MKRGIALGGGGARGAYEMGALKALKEMGYLDRLDAISGVSVGSLNAAFLAHDNIEEGEKLWLSEEIDTIFSKPPSFIKKVFDKESSLLDDGLYETKKLEALIDRMIDYDAMRKANVRVGISYVGDEDTGFFELLRANVGYLFDNKAYLRYVDLTNLSDKDIKSTILASCAIPVVFQPVIIDGKKYFDGGMFERLPCTPLVEMGMDEIIAIDLFRLNLWRKKQRENSTIIHIRPSRGLGRIMDFSPEKNRLRFATGYEDAFKAMREYEEEKKEKQADASGK